MFLAALATSVVAVKFVDLVNEVLEQSVIPVTRLKRGQKKPEERLHSIKLEVALTASDIKKLQASGGMEILERGVNTQSLINKMSAQAS